MAIFMSDYTEQFAQRLNQALDKKEVPARGRSTLLAKEIGVGVKAANKWINGETLPTVDKIVEIAIFTGVTAEWLLTGISSDKVGRTGDDVSSSRLVMARYAPVISWVQAGSWTDMDSIISNDVKEVLPLPPEAGKHSFWLEVQGESNHPEFKHGEKICIDPDCNLSDVQNGEMVVVRVDGTATFKALVIEPNGYYLKALNPSWQPRIMEIPEDAVFIGKYAGSYLPPRRF